MAAKQVPEINDTTTSTGSAVGYITVGSPRKFHVGAYCWLQKIDGTLSQRTKITRITAGGKVYLRLADEGKRENFNLATWTAYPFGSLFCMEQQVVNADADVVEELTVALDASGSATTSPTEIVVNTNNMGIVNQDSTNNLLVSFNNGVDYDVVLKPTQGFSVENEVVHSILVKSNAGTASYNVAWKA